MMESDAWTHLICGINMVRASWNKLFGMCCSIVFEATWEHLLQRNSMIQSY